MLSNEVREELRRCEERWNTFREFLDSKPGVSFEAKEIALGRYYHTRSMALRALEQNNERDAVRFLRHYTDKLGHHMQTRTTIDWRPMC